MSENKPRVYGGDYPYIFVSYAHADYDAALPIIHALVDEGYRVWYDDGIQAGSSFPDHIADRLFGCSCVLMLVSRSSLGSGWCRNEVEYALDLGRSVLPVYLEDVELPRALHLRLGSVQALYWYAYATDDEFNEQLFSNKMLDCCLTEKGKRNRGIRGRRLQLDGRVTAGATDKRESNSDSNNVPSLMQSECAGFVTGITPSCSISGYSWSELKSLSRAIADAADDAEGLLIARQYALVDASGNLLGDQKPLSLSDGTQAGVRILGFRHDRLTSGRGVAGITFELVGMTKEHRMNAGRTNAGGWEKSEMRGWLNATLLVLLPDDIRPLIETVQKPTNNRGQISKHDIAAVTTTDDKLWLLSMRELYGRLSGQVRWSPWFVDAYDDEGHQYKLFADKAVSKSNYSYCGEGQSNSYRWLRSPYADNTSEFIGVRRSGSCCDGTADHVCGAFPCFCI